MASSESLISLTLKSSGLYSHTVQLSIALTLTLNPKPDHKLNSKLWANVHMASHMAWTENSLWAPLLSIPVDGK